MNKPFYTIISVANLRDFNKQNEKIVGCVKLKTILTYMEVLVWWYF